MQKIYRLQNRASFSYIYKKGKRISNNLLTLYFVEAHNLKVGISVSKKIGNSVTRSLVKRRVKEYFRKLIPSLKSNYNYVIVTKEGIALESYQGIGLSLVSLLKKGKLFRDLLNEENL